MPYLSGSTRSIRKSEPPNPRGIRILSCMTQMAHMHVGSTFQHAVVRSINDKNAQLQKQLENLVREGTCFSCFSDLAAKKRVNLFL